MHHVECVICFSGSQQGKQVIWKCTLQDPTESPLQVTISVGV